MSVILARYAEIGLKSAPVRRRFENQLRETFGLTATPIKLTIRERGE